MTITNIMQSNLTIFIPRDELVNLHDECLPFSVIPGLTGNLNPYNFL
jgi:hypothetical protein